VPSMALFKKFASQKTKSAVFNITQSRKLSTVNAEEISHFDRLAATWWDPQGSSRLLHRMNPLRLSFINSLYRQSDFPDTKRWLKGYSVLDVGCGGGILTESLSRLGAVTDGLDASPRAIEVAKAHLRTDPKLNASNPPNYVCGSIRDHQPDSKYDIVTAMEVLEHVDYPSSFLKQVAAHVKPGGWLVISTISRSWQSWLGAIVGAERVLRIVPPGTHSWDKFIKESELMDFMRDLKDENGHHWLAEAKGNGCIYNPLRGEWRMVKGVRGPVFNYFLAARRTEY
jgi:polyprenyldihydroxybenzoate methyltransferase / 3-demethylubiquinol 3-O-methyltransferase